MTPTRHTFAIFALAALAGPVTALGAQQDSARRVTAGLAAGAAADTTARARRTVVTSSAGDIVMTPRMLAAADTAIDQLEDFLREYPDSPLRPNALLQLGELLVRRADEQFAAQQRVGVSTTDTATAAAATTPGRSDQPARADYSAAISRYEELVRRYPNFEKVDAAAYTLGTLYASNQRYADAARMFTIVAARDTSRFAPEALFRLGDAQFELAARERGDARRAAFARAATAYEQAVARSPQQGDIYFLSLYKLGWAYYNQATQTNTEQYDRAVQTFGTLVEAYDKLSPEQQARLGLKQEAIEYMAVAFTQVGVAEAADRYFSQPGRGQYRTVVVQRVAESLRDQGDFSRAVQAYKDLIQTSPNDTFALHAQREIIDIYQNRVLEADSAQAARLVLVERFAPGSAWANANPNQAADAQKAREDALRQSGQFLLNRAQTRRDRAASQQAATLYERYLSEFGQSDSAQAVALYYGEALMGQGEYLRAGAAYNRAAYGFTNRPAAPAAPTDTTAPRDTTARRAAAPVNIGEQAGRNAIVAFDSALARSKNDRATQDSLFTTVERFAAAYPQSDAARQALILKGRRASETQRWDEMAEAFRTYAANYPNDAYTPTAQKLVGDALYRGGQYAEAQVQWEQAQQVAASSGRRALADSITATRATAAGSFADTLIKQGEYRRAAEEVYVSIADKNPQSPRAPEALRDAIETYMLVVDSSKTASNEQKTEARNRAIELSSRLVQQYPNYRYRLQYQNLNARLLTESGRNEDAVEALRGLASNAQNPERASAQLRLAAALDSLRRKGEAAAEYERYANTFQRTREAPDALWNSALTYAEAGDSTNALRVYSVFATRYPRDARARTARGNRYDILIARGDTAAARTELARACAGVAAGSELAERCNAARAAASASAARGTFERARELYQQYDALTLKIATRARLTQAGVQAASAEKRRLLQRLNAALTEVIRSGSAEHVASGTYYLGLAQWEYGRFIENVELPDGLTEAEQESAKQGSTRQAQQFYDAAKKTWQALIQKAEQDDDLKNNAGARPWLDRARQGLEGDVPNDAPSARAPRAPLNYAGMR